MNRKESIDPILLDADVTESFADIGTPALMVLFHMHSHKPSAQASVKVGKNFLNDCPRLRRG